MGQGMLTNYVHASCSLPSSQLQCGTQVGGFEAVCAVDRVCSFVGLMCRFDQDHVCECVCAGMHVCARVCHE